MYGPPAAAKRRLRVRSAQGPIVCPVARTMVSVTMVLALAVRPPHNPCAMTFLYFLPFGVLPSARSLFLSHVIRRLSPPSRRRRPTSLFGSYVDSESLDVPTSRLRSRSFNTTSVHNTHPLPDTPTPPVFDVARLPHYLPTVCRLSTPTLRRNRFRRSSEREG